MKSKTNKKKESIFNNFARRNKTILMFVFFFVFLSIGVIATTISDKSVISSTGDFDNITGTTWTGSMDAGGNNLSNVGSINNVLYVQAGNGSDIQAKLDKCDGSNPCVVYVPSEDYDMTSMLEVKGYTRLIIDGNLDFNYDLVCGSSTAPISIDDVTDDNIIIEGSGTLSFNESKQSVSCHWIRIGNHNNQGVKNIKILNLNLRTYGINLSLSGGCFIGIENSDNVEINGVTIFDENQGKDYGICSNKGQNYRFINNRIYDTDNHGIGFFHNENLLINGNIVSTSTDDNIGWQGINGENTTGLIVSNNIVSTTSMNALVGISIADIEHTDGALITSNNVYGNFTTGIDMKEHAENSIVSNNQIRNTLGDCIRASFLGGAEELQITNNYLFNCGGHGIDVSAAKLISGNSIKNAHKHGIYSYKYADDALISGNTIWNSGQGQSISSNYSGIYITGNVDRLLITGNKISDSQTPKTQAYAIYCNQSGRDINIIGNDFKGNNVSSLGGTCFDPTGKQQYFGNVDSGGIPNYISSDITPNSNSVLNIGSSLLRWLKGWFVNLDVSGTAVIDTLNVTNDVTASSINNVLYVQAGNASDIQAKLDLSSSGQEVRITVPGTYNLDSTLSTTNGDILIMSEGVVLNVTGNFNGINLSTTGNVYISGGRIDVPINSYTHSVMYLNPTTKISSNNPVVIKDIDLYQTADGTGNGVFIETPDNGDSLVFARFEDMIIDDFNISIKLTSTALDGNSYINGNWFNNILSKKGAYMYYINVTGNNEISGNQFNKNQMQSDADALAMVYARGFVNQNYIEIYMFDRPTSDANVIDFGENASDNFIVGNLNIGEYVDESDNLIIGSTTKTIFGINRIYGYENDDYNIRIKYDGFSFNGLTGDEAKLIIQKNGTLSSNNVQYVFSHRTNNEDLYLYTYDGSNYWNILEFDKSEKHITLGGDTEISGNITIGDGTSQENITLTSPDGTEYSCGVANGGAFTCS